MTQERIVVELAYPVKHGVKELDKISLRTRLLVRDLEFLPEIPEGITEEDAAKIKVKPSQMVALIASLADLPKGVIDQIDAMVDLPKLMEALGNFMTTPSQPTGEK